MAYYDEQGFSQMQRDALERMRDMQRRSKSLVFEAPPQAQPAQEPTSAQSTMHNTADTAKTEHRRVHNNPQPKKNDIISSLFSGASGIDSEKLLILLVLFVLYKNKADIKLLIALGYLLI